LNLFLLPVRPSKVESGSTVAFSSLSGFGRGLNLLTLVDGLTLEALLLADNVLRTAGSALSLELLLTLNLSLLLVDGLDKDVLVFVLVTLGGSIHAMVHGPIDFLGFTIPTEKSTEDTEAAHPDELGGHTCVPGTLPSTVSRMATSALGCVPCLRSGTGVDVDLTAHDQTILRQFADVLAGVSESHFASLIGVNPNSFLTTLQY